MSSPQPPKAAPSSPGQRARRPRWYIVISAVLLSGLLAAACSSSGGSNTAKAGDTSAGTSTDAPSELSIATPSLPTSFSFDAGGGAGLEFQEFLKLNNASLLRNPYKMDKAGQLRQDVYHYEGYLAESYSISSDGLTITLPLRKGIKSAAGNPFTADDVIFSFQLKYGTPTSSAKAVNFPYITDPGQIKKIDDFTVSITLLRPSDAFTVLSLISNIANYIYDSTVLKSHATPADPFGVAWSKTNANFGYGPYVLDTFVPDQQMTLHANPDHPLGVAPIKKLTFKLVVDPASRANALRSGDVDVASALLSADQVQLAKDKKLKVYSYDTNSYLLYSFVTNHPPFDDKRVRQALAYAIPYQQIIDSVYAGSRAKRSVGILEPDAPGYDGTGLTPWSYDTAKAKALLAEAGHKDGVSFTLTVSNAVPDVQAAAVLIQSYAKAAGFTVTINQLPPATYAAQRLTHNWDAFMYRDYAITLSPPYQLYLFFKPPPAPSATAWAPQAYYDTLDKGIAAGDPLSDEAGKIWNEGQKYLLDEVPMVFVMKLQPLNAFKATVKNMAWRSDNLIDYFPLELAE